MGEQTRLEIGTIVLSWNTWTPWLDLLVDNRRGAGVHIPNRAAGVYEVKYADHTGAERLHIGRTNNLRARIRQGLVKGGMHSTSRRIRQAEDVSRLVIRWATTDRPAAAEEELHRLYRDTFGRLPKHTLVTLVSLGWLVGGMDSFDRCWTCTVTAGSNWFVQVAVMSRDIEDTANLR